MVTCRKSVGHGRNTEVVAYVLHVGRRTEQQNMHRERDAPFRTHRRPIRTDAHTHAHHEQIKVIPHTTHTLHRYARHAQHAAHTHSPYAYTSMLQSHQHGLRYHAPSSSSSKASSLSISPSPSACRIASISFSTLNLDAIATPAPVRILETRG